MKRITLLSLSLLVGLNINAMAQVHYVTDEPNGVAPDAAEEAGPAADEAPVVADGSRRGGFIPTAQEGANADDASSSGTSVHKKKWFAGGAVTGGSDKRFGNGLQLGFSADPASQVMGGVYLTGRPADGVVTEPSVGFAGRVDGLRLNLSDDFYFTAATGHDLSLVTGDGHIDGYVGAGVPILDGKACFLGLSLGFQGQGGNTMTDDKGKKHATRMFGSAAAANVGCALGDRLSLGAAVTFGKPIFVPQGQDDTKLGFYETGSLFGSYRVGKKKGGAITLQASGELGQADYRVVEDRGVVREGKMDPISSATVSVGYAGSWDVN